MLIQVDILDTVEKYLKEVGKDIVIEAQKNLPNSNSVKSLKSKTVKGKETVSLTFEGPENLLYIDKGVSGTNVKYDTSFSYGNKFPNINSIREWAKGKTVTTKRGVTQELSAYMVAKTVYERGIKPTYFLTNAVMKSDKSPEWDKMTKEIQSRVVNSLKEQFKTNSKLKVT